MNIARVMPDVVMGALDVSTCDGLQAWAHSDVGCKPQLQQSAELQSHCRKGCTVAAIPVQHATFLVL